MLAVPRLGRTISSSPRSPLVRARRGISRRQLPSPPPRRLPCRRSSPCPSRRHRPPAPPPPPQSAPQRRLRTRCTCRRRPSAATARRHAPRRPRTVTVLVPGTGRPKTQAGDVPPRALRQHPPRQEDLRQLADQGAEHVQAFVLNKRGASSRAGRKGCSGMQVGEVRRLVLPPRRSPTEARAAARRSPPTRRSCSKSSYWRSIRHDVRAITHGTPGSIRRTPGASVKNGGSHVPHVQPSVMASAASPSPH